MLIPNIYPLSTELPCRRACSRMQIRRHQLHVDANPNVLPGLRVWVNPLNLNVIKVTYMLLIIFREYYHAWYIIQYFTHKIK